MYNAETKNAYLNSLREQGKSDYIIRNATNAFNKSEAMEIQLDKDICLFSEDEIKTLYKSLGFGSLTSLTSINYQYLYYVDFCISIGICHINTFTNIKRLTVKDCIKQVYYSPIEINMMERELVNICDKFIIVAAYYGFSTDDNYKDFSTLTRESFNTKTNMITLWDGRAFKCPRSMIQNGLASFDIYKYYQAKGGVNTLVGDGILKTMPKSNKTDGTDYNTIIPGKFSRVFRKQFNDSNLTYTHVRNSGIVYFTNQLIFDEGCKDIHELWYNKRFKKEIIDRYKIGYSITAFDGAFGQNIKYDA